MPDTARQTRSYLMKLLSRHGLHPRTDLGQNFLIDLNLLEFIVEQAEFSPQDVVLEVGAGTGSLTAQMAPRAAAVVSVEIDKRMFAIATEVIAAFNNVTLLNIDALKNKNHLAPALLDAVRQRLAEDSERRLKLVANLPYNVATPVISNLVAGDLPWTLMLVTVQLEVAQRMTAAAGSGHYGALSVWLQSQCRVEILKKLPPSVFWPRPQVTSAIVKIVPVGESGQLIRDREFFHDFLRRVFQQRRKLLRSVMAGMYRPQLQKSAVDAILAEVNVGETARAEELDVPTLIELANHLRERIV